MDNIKMREWAIENGLCRKWAAKWKDDFTKEEQLEMLMSLDGMDFLGQKEFPSTGFLIREYGNMLEKYGLYVKKTGTIKPDTYALKTHIVNSDCHVVIPPEYIGYLYISNNSNVTAELGHHCDCIIKCFAGSTIDVQSIGVHGEMKLTIIED